MDKVQITDLEVFARHGVFPEENKLGQKFLVCVQMYMDVEQAVQQDNIEQAVNYGEVCYFIKDWMEQHTMKLLETVADLLAKDILMRFPMIERIILEVKKPNAPVMLPFGCVSVEVDRRWHDVYVGVGSNLGDRKATIQEALHLLKMQEGCRIGKISDLIETEPYGYTDQDTFLNGCIQVKTVQRPEEFLETLHAIENALGRERTIHWGPRTLDLDILLYDDLIYNSETLTIPHSDMQNREFVLKPLAQIAGTRWHPVLRKTINQIYHKLEEQNQ